MNPARLPRLQLASARVCLVLLWMNSWLSHAQSAVLAQRQGDAVSLSNELISANWSVRDGTLAWKSMANRLTAKTLSIEADVFELVPKEGAVLRPADFRLVAEPSIEDIPPSATSSRAGDRLSG